MKCYDCGKRLKTGDIIYPLSFGVTCDDAACRLAIPSMLIQPNVSVIVEPVGDGTYVLSDFDENSTIKVHDDNGAPIEYHGLDEFE